MQIDAFYTVSLHICNASDRKNGMYNVWDALQTGTSYLLCAYFYSQWSHCHFHTQIEWENFSNKSKKGIFFRLLHQNHNHNLFREYGLYGHNYSWLCQRENYGKKEVHYIFVLLFRINWCIKQFLFTFIHFFFPFKA